MENIRYKYPRTLHLPWSDGKTSDDKVCGSIDHFIGHEVVVTEKMDGENTSIYKDFFHARSTTSNKHPSRNLVSKLQSELQHELPIGFRVCGENCYAKHSIEYTELDSYFLAFSVWEGTKCLSWQDTETWCGMLNLHMVPVLYKGVFDEKIIKSLYVDDGQMEGYVVRKTSSFMYDDFSTSVAKFVRQNHVQTSDHWMYQTIIPNTLKNS